MFKLICVGVVLLVGFVVGILVGRKNRKTVDTVVEKAKEIKEVVQK